MVARKSCAALNCGASYLPCAVKLEKGVNFSHREDSRFFEKVAYRPPRSLKMV